MGTCKNCYFWGRYMENVCDKIDLDDSPVTGNNASLQVDVSDDSGLFAKLVTGPDFGCTLFHDKTKT
mgnify:FL=1